MPQLDGVTIGLILAGSGLLFWLITRVSAALAARRKTDSPRLASFAVASQPFSHQDGLLIIEPGGKIQSINERARKMLQLSALEQPNLERIARRFRPQETFMQLCAQEGSARLILNGRAVEATSYQIAVKPVEYMQIFLRFPEATLPVGSSGQLPSRVLNVVGELTQSLMSSVDLEATLAALFAAQAKLIPADFSQITLWDPENENWASYRMENERLVRYASISSRQGSLYAKVKEDHNPKLVLDTAEETEFQDASEMRSVLLLPLEIGAEFIGVIELRNRPAGALQETDVNLGRLLARQAAAAVRGARLYHRDQYRAAELGGLSRLTQNFIAVTESGQLFANLVEAIRPLVSVNFLGFLIYNETAHQLEGQSPFFGLPEQFVDIYHAPAGEGTAFAQAMLDQDLLISEDACTDSKWIQLGMDHLAQAASLHETVLVPLVSGGRMLGFLQASNHSDGVRTFTKDELRLLTIAANQAAPVIENSALVVQSRKRAQRAEALQRITSLASSAHTLDETLTTAIDDLARVMQADTAAALLLDSSQTRLQLHSESIYGDACAVERIRALKVQDSQFPFTVTGSQQPLVYHLSEEENPLIGYYNALATAWELQSIIAVPMLSRSGAIGELFFGSKRGGFFDPGDLQLLVTAAGQLAGVIEQNRLLKQTDESLRRRVDELTALTRISRELSGSLDLRVLLLMVFDEALRTTRADCGSLLLFDMRRPSDQPLKVRYSVGDTPAEDISALELHALASGQSVIVTEMDDEEYAQPHFGVASALIVPVIYQQRPAGLIVLHASDKERFDDTALEISQSLASQAAVALGNAVQYEDQLQRSTLLKRQLDTLSNLFAAAQTQRSEQPLENALGALAEAIRQATPFQMVLVSLYEPSDQQLYRLVGAGIPEDTWKELRAHHLRWESIKPLLQPAYQFGSAFFIPADKVPVVPEDVHTVTVLPESEVHELDLWNADDFLLVALLNSQGEPLGLISLDAPSDGRRPDKPTFDALNLFANQAVLTIENRKRVSELEADLLKTKAAHIQLLDNTSELTTELPELRMKEAQQNEVIGALCSSLQRSKSGLEIMERISQETDLSGVLRTCADELMGHYGLQTALVMERSRDRDHLLLARGITPEGVNFDAMLGQRNPLRSGIESGSVLLVENVSKAEEWKNNPFLTVLQAGCFLCLPVQVNPNYAAAVLAIGSQTLPVAVEEDRQVLNRIARQLAVTLQNIYLLQTTQTRLREMDTLVDFTRRLSAPNPTELLRTLIETCMKLIPTAGAGWAALWQPREDRLRVEAAAGFNDDSEMRSVFFVPTNLTSRQPMPLRVLNFREPLRVDELRFAKDYALDGDELLHYRQASGGKLPTSCLLVPLVQGDQALGVLALEQFDGDSIFTPEDEALASSLTRQTALVLDNARLLVESQGRAAQMSALNRVAGTITSSLRHDELVALLLDQLATVLPFETATLWLREGENLMVASAAGFEDNESRLGLTVAMQDSVLFNEMVHSGQPLLVDDIRQDPRFPRLVEPDKLSWLGVPLLAKSGLVGLIALEKREPGYYSQDQVQSAVTFANQAVMALENARLYEDSVARSAELDQRSQRLAMLNTLSTELSTSLDIDRILTAAAGQLGLAMASQWNGAILLDEQKQAVLKVVEPAGNLTLPQKLPEMALFARLQESMGIFTTTDAAAESDLQPLASGFFSPNGIHSVLFVPLTAGADLQGWLLAMDVVGRHFLPGELELARTIANQTAMAVQNARLYAETRTLTEYLEKRVELRTSELRQEHQNTQALLKIITELTSSLEVEPGLERALQAINEASGAQQTLVLRPDANLPVIQSGEKLVEPGKFEQQLAVKASTNHATLQIDDLQKLAPQMKDPPYRSSLVVPLILGQDTLGTLMLLNREPGQFSSRQVALVEAAARQISMALNNANLFKLITDQAVKLQGMLLDQQIETSRSRAILEAVADGVVVTGEDNQVFLFNASAERVLSMKAEDVVGKPLDQFRKVFGKEAGLWLQTIQRWSENPADYLDSEPLSQQVTLENGTVVSIHLAPVFNQSYFLGTVSIFRDITHEVQVDRLKSEFVANVSHELRTPMTSIKGYTKVLLVGAVGTLNVKQIQFMQLIKNNTERLELLVNDLLDISRIESGRLTLQHGTVDLKALAEDVIAEVKERSESENRPMNFILDANGRLPRIPGDPERLRQVIGNLVSNGYAYTPPNGTVEVKIYETSEGVQMDISDTGIGIARGERERIFERFYRGQDPLVMATSGTGLGLALSKTLVEMHHGRIWFRSSGVPGEGSTFSFVLPIHWTED